LSSDSLIDDRLSALDRAQRAALHKFGVKIVADVLAADEPIQLDDAYAHLRITADSNGSDDDVWLEAQIPAARGYCEQFLGRSLAEKTLELASNKFPCISVDEVAGPCIELPFGPVQSIASVKYLVEQDVLDSNGDPELDSDGNVITEVVELTLDAATYAIDSYVTPNRLVLAYGESWPTALDTINSVKIRYVAGYVPEAESNGYLILPRMARSAMLLMLAHLFENREAAAAAGGTLVNEIPLGVQALLELTPNRERLGMV
jgi:uncharacterized phiE125 gp8 family phage protein